MSEQQQPEQATPSAEQQPIQQPAPVVPEQPAPDPAQVPNPAPAEQQPIQQPAPVVPEQPAPDPAQVPNPAPAEQVPPAQPAPANPDETTDAGDGAGDQPEPGEQAAVVADDAVSEAPPNPHAGDGEGSAGFGVTGKFVHDEAPDDAGAEDAGSQ